MRRIVGELSGRSAQAFVELLREQVEATRAGAQLALEATRASTPEESRLARERMQAAEHEGDSARANLIDQLGVALVTPVDREDLFRLSRSIDDVLDNLRDFVRELDLYRVYDRASFAPAVEAILAALDELEAAVSDLSAGTEVLSGASLRVRKSSNNVRRLYQEAVAELFAGQLDLNLLKRRELVRRLDVVGTRLNDAADALADAAIKRQR